MKIDPRIRIRDRDPLLALAVILQEIPDETLAAMIEILAAKPESHGAREACTNARNEMRFRTLRRVA